MQTTNIRSDSLGSETYEVLGFKTEEELNKEILKLIQFRSEFINNSERVSF